MLNMKRILITTTVLSAMCASALAAEPDKLQQEPSMRSKVNAILHQENKRDCMPKKDFEPHHRKHLTNKQREEMHKRQEEWKKLTPEQRDKEIKKMQKIHQQEHNKHAKETMSKLTDKQRAEVEQFIKDDIAHRQARKERLRQMTPQQREAVRANRPMKKHPPKHDFKHHKNVFHAHGPQHHSNDFPPPSMK